MHAHQGAVLACLAQRSEDGRVVGQHHPRIGHEQLVARHPFVGETAHLRNPVGREIGDDHVEGVVDRGPAGCLRVPGVERFDGGRATRLDREVHDTRRSSVGGGAGTGLEGVRGHRSAERHLDVGVGIDPARDDEPSRCVDHGIGVDHQVAADQGHGFVADEDVGMVVVDRGDDSSVLDQHAHCLYPALERRPVCRRSRPAGRNSISRDVALRFPDHSAEAAGARPTTRAVHPAEHSRLSAVLK